MCKQRAKRLCCSWPSKESLATPSFSAPRVDSYPEWQQSANCKRALDVVVVKGHFAKAMVCAIIVDVQVPQMSSSGCTDNRTGSYGVPQRTSGPVVAVSRRLLRQFEGSEDVLRLLAFGDGVLKVTILAK